MLGLSYKKNIDDLRESPSLDLIKHLEKFKAKVSYHDPFFKQLPVTRKNNSQKASIELNPENLKKADLVLIATDHDVFDYNLIEKHSKLIVDTRGRMQPGNNIYRS